MNKLLIKLSQSRTAQALTASAVMLTGLSVAGIAGATTYDPTTGLTALGTSAGNTAEPLVLAVVGGLIGLGAVIFLSRKVLHIFGIRF